MALIKCKECGNQVSKQAETCPQCGAPIKKKRASSNIGCGGFIVIVVFLGWLASLMNPSTNSAPAVTPKAQSNQIAGKSATPKPVKTTFWSTSTSADKMTGKTTAYASSRKVSADKPMGFPYHDVKAWMGIGCDGKKEWAYVGFSTAPNLSDTKTEDGYNLIKTRVNWDGTIQNVTMTQRWSAEFLHFRNPASIINRISGSNSALLELRWHGQEPAYFEFALTGSSAAIKEMRSVCGK